MLIFTLSVLFGSLKDSFAAQLIHFTLTRLLGLVQGEPEVNEPRPSDISNPPRNLFAFSLFQPNQPLENFRSRQYLSNICRFCRTEMLVLNSY